MKLIVSNLTHSDAAVHPLQNPSSAWHAGLDEEFLRAEKCNILTKSFQFSQTR